MQLDLFDRKTPTPPPTDPNVIESDEHRLTGQNARILEMLQEGAVTAAELSAIALKYTSRISDLRKAGYRITCHRIDGGNNVYRLEG